MVAEELFQARLVAQVVVELAVEEMVVQVITELLAQLILVAVAEDKVVLAKMVAQVS